MFNNDLGKKQLALEELKLLQFIAQNQDNLRFKIRGWCAALITALVVSYMSQEIALSATQFVITSSLILFLFLWLDVLYRVAQDRAYNRSKIVEENLRGIGKYSGPLIRDSLSVPNSIEDQLLSLNNIRVYGPYVFLFIIVMLLAFANSFKGVNIDKIINPPPESHSNL